MKLSDSLFLQVYGICFAIVGVFVLRWGRSEIKRSRRSRHWPSVLGQIISSEVRIAPTQHFTTYWPLLCYEYEVEGTHYTRTIKATESRLGTKVTEQKKWLKLLWLSIIAAKN